MIVMLLPFFLTGDQVLADFLGSIWASLPQYDKLTGKE
jgi:hypothetical protein